MLHRLRIYINIIRHPKTFHVPLHRLGHTLQMPTRSPIDEVLGNKQDTRHCPPSASASDSSFLAPFTKPNSIRFFFLIMAIAAGQIFINLIWYLRYHHATKFSHHYHNNIFPQGHKTELRRVATLSPTPQPTSAPPVATLSPAQLETAIHQLEAQIGELKETLNDHGQNATHKQLYAHDEDFYPFTIRDSKRLTPVQVSPDFHIFDYVDTKTGRQLMSKAMELWLDGHYLEPAVCSRYVILCYKKKIIQVMMHLLEHTNATYFFYMESDNELCVPMTEIRDLAYRHRRYFIGTGIGFSGWIMNRTFIEDFLEAYIPPHKHANESPDPIGARLLMEKKEWTVTRNYLVSHTIKEGFGMSSLTVGRKDRKTGEVKETKHLPRCLEPKRTKWFEWENSTEDMHGWDFFDADDCPPETEIYPCRPDQYVNVTYGVKDMLKPRNETKGHFEKDSPGAKTELEAMERKEAASEAALTKEYAKPENHEGADRIEDSRYSASEFVNWVKSEIRQKGDLGEPREHDESHLQEPPADLFLQQEKLQRADRIEDSRYSAAEFTDKLKSLTLQKEDLSELREQGESNPLEPPEDLILQEEKLHRLQNKTLPRPTAKHGSVESNHTNATAPVQSAPLRIANSTQSNATNLSIVHNNTSNNHSETLRG